MTDAGIGLLGKGNIAVYESDQSMTYKGKKITARTICIREFKGEKFQSARSISDDLSVVKQAASQEGWFTRTIVNSVAKGL